MKLFPGETRETSIPHTHRVVVFDNEGFVELGTILIDAYTRPGKRGLAFTSCLKRCSGTNPVTRTSALALISLALPADSQELGLDKTWELMHEFGHALSVVCVRSELLCQSGFDVPVDCVEGISTFFQKLATNKEVLEHIFKQPISKAAIQAMLQAGVWQEAKNIAYATIDYYLHTCSPRGLGSIYRYGQNVAQNIWQLQLPNNWGMTLTHWGRRIFTEGDESRYYMYVMGEPLAQGLQGRVDAAGGLGSPGGQAIVRNVLERGHTRPILETFLN